MLERRWSSQSDQYTSQAAQPSSQGGLDPSHPNTDHPPSYTQASTCSQALAVPGTVGQDREKLCTTYVEGDNVAARRHNNSLRRQSARPNGETPVPAAAEISEHACSAKRVGAWAHATQGHCRTGGLPGILSTYVVSCQGFGMKNMTGVSGVHWALAGP